MSRIGKVPITIPKGVTVDVKGGLVTVKGALGTLTLSVNSEVTAEVAGDKLTVTPKNEEKRAQINWGTTRALINNMVNGVSKGYTTNLEINGVGYRAAVQGKNLVLQLGFSHDVTFPIPADIKIACEKPTAIAVTGADRQRVGQVAAVIRSFRGPEPYKGKGIKYQAEKIRRKEGKKK